MIRIVLSPLAVFALLLALSSPLSAAIINSPVPSNAYITHNGYEWAWAYPLPGADLSYQGTQGWRIPTPAELALAPLATDFLFAGGNVPFNGTDPVSGAFFGATNANYTLAGSAGAVAVPYFSNNYLHADWQDGLGQPFGPWFGMAGAAGFGDQLVIRDLAAVPEPASMLAWGLIAGVGAVGCRLRKRKAAVV